MDKRRIYHIIEWSVAIAACAFLIWKIATYDDYASLLSALRAMAWPQWLAFIACVALMPVNMALEAWRWRTLWNGASELGISELGISGLEDERISGLVDEGGSELGISELGISGLEDERISGLGDERMSFREAQRQVYYSKLAGLITPWKLGEYPARALLIEGTSQESRVKSQETWSRVLSMGAVGSATMTAVIIACGAIAMMIGLAISELAISGDWKLEIGNWKLEIGDWKFSYLIIVAVVLLLLGLALYFAPRLLKRWAEVSHKLVLISLGQSFVRLLCWCVQLALVLWAVDGFGVSGLVDEGISGLVDEGISGLGIGGLVAKTFVYYLLVTITPNVPIAEVGVRGAWAIVVFGTMNAALAGVLLWIINTLLPCLFALGISAKRQTSR